MTDTKSPPVATNECIIREVTALKTSFNNFVDFEKERRATDAIPNGKQRMERTESRVDSLRLQMRVGSTLMAAAIFIVPVLARFWP